MQRTRWGRIHWGSQALLLTQLCQWLTVPVPQWHQRWVTWSGGPIKTEVKEWPNIRQPANTASQRRLCEYRRRHLTHTHTHARTHARTHAASPHPPHTIFLWTQKPVYLYFCSRLCNCIFLWTQMSVNLYFCSFCVTISSYGRKCL